MGDSIWEWVVWRRQCSIPVELRVIFVSDCDFMIGSGVAASRNSIVIGRAGFSDDIIRNSLAWVDVDELFDKESLNCGVEIRH